MKFEIKKVKNGWLLHAEDEEDTTLVQEEKYDSEEECFLNFLRAITEHFGPSYNKWNEKNVFSMIVPGRSFAGALDKEYLERLIDYRNWFSHAIDQSNEKNL